MAIAGLKRTKPKHSAMIDVHCHLLPGIDDGADSLPVALQMAKQAVANGIRHAVLTPHITPGRYDNDLQTIDRACQEFRGQLLQHNIALTVSLAAEVSICPELMHLLPQGEIPFLGKLDGLNILLLEFPHSHIPPGSLKLVEWLLHRNVRPMIAHPERNKDVHRNIEKIAPFVQSGCLLQLTAASVAGGFGPVSQERSEQLLERGWVKLLASDAHNANHRIPDLNPGREAAARLIGDEAAWHLVREAPASIVGDIH